LDLELDAKYLKGTARVELFSINALGQKLLALLEKGAKLGKLFAKDPRRYVRDPFYLRRMFDRKDRDGTHLLSLSGLKNPKSLRMEKIEGRTVAFIPLQKGVCTYTPQIESFLPTLSLALKEPLSIRKFLKLFQTQTNDRPIVKKNQLLLVKTAPLHIRTVFGRVAEDLLPKGYRHTRANILDPHTQDSGDVYEFYGESDIELAEIPLEFFTLEYHKEYVFFKDRDQLQNYLEDPDMLFKTFATAPGPKDKKTAVFVVKGEQMQNLKPEDWIIKSSTKYDFPGIILTTKQSELAEKYIHEQPAYPFLKAIENGSITSEGILITRDLPSPLLKRMLLSYYVHKLLKAIYFEMPSTTEQGFFSHEDRSLLLDLAKFGICCYWVDKTTHQILQFIPKKGTDSGMFVPKDRIQEFLKATTFGVYGSNLVQGDFENELRVFFKGVLKLKRQANHPLLNPQKTLALITGGGPGAMEVGNRIAKEFHILSCANIVNFNKSNVNLNEQSINPYIDAKMTYRLDKLVERQAEFNLDFPLFLVGGIGTDFEYALEEVRRKTGSHAPTPVFLFGGKEHWSKKIKERFLCNMENGTIKGSEWISNCFYAVNNAKEALYILEQFVKGELPIGPKGPIYEDGFATASSLMPDHTH
ncbi:MAG: hypothetical protein K940chlam8_00492, partial [Chlamydiae bacterium]|nr:hypothetical protein [Chlamydiota bacterium]